MPGKIFVNYRRDDERATAARIRDRLTATFGASNVFMDVDNLMAGQRFDKELERALAETDVFLAVIGARWLELLAEREKSGERDYVREEIAGALRRGIVVIPVLVERTPLPRADALPEDIRELVLHQKQAVTHERFGRDVEDLTEAIQFARRTARAGSRGGGSAARYFVGAAALAVLLLGGGVLVSQMGVVTHRIREGDLAAGQVKSPTRVWSSDGRQQLGPFDDLIPGKVFRDCADKDAGNIICPEMVVIPAGLFTMGSPSDEAARSSNEGPQRKVTIDRSFAVGKFEVTFAEWEACAADRGCTSNPSPSDQGWGKGRRPVINVSWLDAKEYVAWLSRKTGKTYRLLSEAEWEYVARAGTTTRYAFGDTITKSRAHFDEYMTAEVGSFPGNAFGLHDLHGNVREWVEDAWHDDYKGAPTDGSVWHGGNVSYRVLRGGSWFIDPDGLRSASRIGDQPGGRYSSIGFRVARTL